MRRGWGRRAHAVPMHDAVTGRADRATARRPERACVARSQTRPHLTVSRRRVNCYRLVATVPYRLLRPYLSKLGRHAHRGSTPAAIDATGREPSLIDP
jgi:hypothetical protein